ncbi:MAG: hypothetical protein HQ594_05165 [Candidatus Omnitrophica bacterium]|nr:hypothetical protein [Candidatus Omnitrophota bacterium]
MNFKMFLAVFMVFSFLLVPVAYSDPAEGQGGESSEFTVGHTLRTLINYPAFLIQKTAELIENTLNGTADTVKGTVVATGETLTGDVGKAPGIVTTPLTGTAVGAKDVVVGVAKVPMEAGAETEKYTD